MKMTVLTAVYFICLQFSLSAHLSVTGVDIPRDTSYTVYQNFIKIRKDYPEARPVAAMLPNTVLAERGLVYAVLNDSVNRNRELHLDLLRPAELGIYPAVIMIHGGGWQSGDKSMQVPMAMQVAAKGYITAAVE